MRTLSLIQIYYDDIQKEEIYPFAIPYKNHGLTPFFENSVIAELVPCIVDDYISICSWSLKRKRQAGPTPIVLKGDTSLTEEKILSNDFDVAVLTPRSSSHQMLHMASQWHPQVWDKAFAQLDIFLRKELNTKIKSELKTTVYENHFIARKEIYHAYVKDFLVPTMDFMKWDIKQKGNESVFLLPSGYYKRKRAKPEETARIKKMLGFDDWPIAPFILERLFSIYINDKNLNVINL